MIQHSKRSFDNDAEYEVDEEDPDLPSDSEDDKVPIEAFCQRAALERDPSHPYYTLLLLAWKTDKKLRQWKLYSEYCGFEGKTLEDLILAHLLRYGYFLYTTWRLKLTGTGSPNGTR